MINNVLEQSDIDYMDSLNIKYMVSGKILEVGDSILTTSSCYLTIEDGYYFATWGNYLSNGTDFMVFDNITSGSTEKKNITFYTSQHAPSEFLTGLNEMHFVTYAVGDPEPVNPSSGVTGYELTSDDITEFENNDIEFKINGVLAVAGYTFKENDVCVATITNPLKMYSDGVGIKFSGNYSPSGTPEVNFTVAADGITANHTWSLVDVESSVHTLITYVGSVPIVYTVTDSDITSLASQNITGYLNSVEITEQTPVLKDDLLEFIIDSNTHEFDVAGVYIEGSYSPSGTPRIDFNISVDKTTASYTFTDDSIAYYTLGTNLVAINDLILYTFTSADMVTLTNNTVEISINGTIAETGTNIYYGDVLTGEIIGNAREFKDSAAYPYKAMYLIADYVPSQTEKVLFTTVSKTLVNHTFGEESLPPNANWVLNINTEIITEELEPTNNVYVIDSDKLEEVNVKRFKFVDDIYIDYGRYIISALRLPFNLPIDLIGGLNNIWLGDLDTGVTTEQLLSDKIAVDMGTIEILSTHNNMLDYINVVCELNLPYSPPVTLDINDVIDKTITIEYVINTYTGNVVINVFSNGVLISNTSVDIGVKIPMINEIDVGQITNSGLILGSDNGIREAYISLTKSVEVLADGFYTVPVKKESDLSLEKGYIVVDEINLVSQATTSEKEMLIDILKTGVIIND